MATNAQFRRDSASGRTGLKMIADAAKLMLRCAGYFGDRQDETNGWKVFYAVDVDVIKFYLAPEAESRYASVFSPEADDETRNVLARLIGNFIFRESRTCNFCDGKETQLFIIHPHDDELADILLALSREVVDAAADLREQKGSWAKKLTYKLTSEQPDAIAQWLIDTAPALVAILDDDSGSRAQLKRFEALDPSRILNIERYKETTSDWTFPIPQTLKVTKDFEEFALAIKSWRERLQRHRSPSQKTRQLDCDAYVLATLELLNSRMASERRKIVLVTGTGGIMSAADEYRLSGFGEGATSFADLYIRHPQAFLADPLFFANTSEELSGVSERERFELVDWLNVFFPRVMRQDAAVDAPVIDRGQLRELVRRPDRSFDDTVRALAINLSSAGVDFPDAMLKQWQTQVRSAAVFRGLADGGSSRVENARRFLQGLLEQVAKGTTVEQALDDLANRAVLSVSALYSSTSILRLHYIRLGPMREGIRGIPALRFGRMPEAAEYCRQLVKSVRGPDGGGVARIDLVEMYAKLSQQDNTHYYAHVVHALAYAAKGYWHAARTLSRIALAIADGLADEARNGRQGREAAYLLAVAERRLARGVKDLDAARLFLQQAASRENAGKELDIRFRSESVALDVAKLNFDVFVYGNSSSALTVFDGLFSNVLELLELAALEPVDSIGEWVTQQLFTNALDVALIVKLAGISVSDELFEKVRSLVALADSKLRDQRSRAHNFDEVAEFIWLVAVIVFGTNPANKAADVRKLSDLRCPVFTPFDKERENAFRKLAASGGRG